MSSSSPLPLDAWSIAGVLGGRRRTESALYQCGPAPATAVRERPRPLARDDRVRGRGPKPDAASTTLAAHGRTSDAEDLAGPDTAGSRAG
jgi:hypothetical protein